MRHCVLLADCEGNAWEFARAVYAKLREKSDKFELNEVHTKRFRDGEIKIKIQENIRGRNCFFIHDSSLPPAEWFLRLVLVNEALRYSSATEITDVLPYIRFSRQDRKDESRVAVNARALAEVVAIYAHRVLTIDAHNALLPSMYRIPFDNLHSSRLLDEYLKKHYPDLLKETVVMSPDVGGTSRAKAFALRLGIGDIVIGYKYREKAGEISDFKIVGDVKGKNVLLVDDILDSGNTLIAAATAVKKAGAKKVYVYCTHGIFSEGREKVCDALDLLFVTNSIAQQTHSNLRVIALDELFAEAIFRTSEGLSLSQLFE